MDGTEREGEREREREKEGKVEREETRNYNFVPKLCRVSARLLLELFSSTKFS